MRLRGSLTIALILCAASLHAQRVATPDQLSVEGAGQLQRVGEAHRTDLMGTLDLYTIAIYSNGAASHDSLASTDVAKALRIQVTYTEDLNRRVAIEWRAELVPRLEPQAVAHLRGSFAPLRHGDVVSIEYTPARGTSVRVNKGVVVHQAHHELMLAFLDHWLGNRPVSEELKQTLLPGR